MKIQEKRNVRGYKVKDSIYNKALRRANKEGGALSNILECVIIGYASGMKVFLSKDSTDLLDVAETIALAKSTKGGKK